MADDRRLTTDRFYGGTSRRIILLKQFLFFLNDTDRTRSDAKDWILSNTGAQSRDAIDRHLGFLDAIELINLSDEYVSLDKRGIQYIQTPQSIILYEALESNVTGFNTILRQLTDGPLSDEDIMDLLKSQFEEINMDSPGVASRHREWLQVLGYINYSDGVSRLTQEGRQLIKELDKDDQLSDSERVSELRDRLLNAEMACVPAGQQHLTKEIYPVIKRAYPNLCEDSYLCKDAHKNGKEQPEWKHAVRDIQQRLADKEGTRVKRIDQRNMWQFLPRFDVCNVYKRSRLHDQLGGQRQRGISPCREVDVILLFTSFSGTEEGYSDTIANDGTVVYTGEGREGDMTLTHGNRAISQHQDDSREIHLFETVTQGNVRYLGQYRCNGYSWEKSPDANDELRDAIQFELVPNSTEFVYSDTESNTKNIELPEGSDTIERRTSTQNSIVRNQTLVRNLKEIYDDICQICGDKRLQGEDVGFSHVHHLMPLGNPHSGDDKPENVIVLCPNHHEDFENGMIEVDPQTLKIQHLYETDLCGETIETRGDHKIGSQYLAYHNEVIASDQI
jgi:hypothetical protein